MVDLYTKAVLTVIAGALLALVVQNGVKSASAQGGICGSDFNPCAVRNSSISPFIVKVVP